MDDKERTERILYADRSLREVSLHLRDTITLLEEDRCKVMNIKSEDMHAESCKLLYQEIGDVIEALDELNDLVQGYCLDLYFKLHNLGVIE